MERGGDPLSLPEWTQVFFLNREREPSMKNLTIAVFACCVSLAAGGVYAQEMKKDEMKKEMMKGEMKKEMKKGEMKKDAMSKDEMMKDKHTGGMMKDQKGKGGMMKDEKGGMMKDEMKK